MKEEVEEEIKKKEREEVRKILKETWRKKKPQIKITKGKTKKYVRISGIQESLEGWVTVDEFTPRGLAKAFAVAKEEFGLKLQDQLEELARRHGWTEEEIREFRRLISDEKQDLYGEGLESIADNVVKRFKRNKERVYKMWNRILSSKKKRGRPKKSDQ